MRPVISILPILLPLAALAQDGPSFDCSKAVSGAEEAVCADPELAALDRRVAEAYAAARDVAGGGAAEEELQAYQRGWIGGRDECWKADDPDDCVRQSYLRREAELVTQWNLQSPTDTTFWSCDGTPANEVVTVFYDTPLPSLRFERGDSIDTGTLVETGSGARYMGSFGREIWIKGEEAIYREPDPDGSTYICVIEQR